MATMRARRLPGTDRIAEHLQTVEGVLEMAADDCVITLAREGKSHQDARSRAIRRSEVLTPQNLESFELARRVLAEQWPVLESEGQGEQVVTPANELRQHVESEDFFQNLEAIRLASKAIQDSYGKFYAELFDKRRHTYERAVNEIKGLPEWSQLYPDPKQSKVEQNALLAPLASKITQAEPDLSGGASVCRKTGATIAEMKSDLDARADRPEDGEEPDGHGLRPINYAWTNQQVQTAGTLVNASAEVIGEAIQGLKNEIETAPEQELARCLAEGSQ